MKGPKFYFCNITTDNWSPKITTSCSSIKTQPNCPLSIFDKEIYNITCNNDNCYAKCVKGFYNIGSETMKCDGEMKFWKRKPNCIRICEDLPSPLNAIKRITNVMARKKSKNNLRSGIFVKMEIEMNVSQTIQQLPYHVHLPGTTVKFDCEPLYRLFGSRLRSCLPNGEWSGRETVCIMECGKVINSTFRAKISHGTIVRSNFDYPWRASLQLKLNKTLGYIHFCGGSIINDRYLLTAAHCVYTPYQQNKINLSSIHVAFSNNLKEVSQLNKTEIKRIIVHPDYDPVTYSYDIALIQLERSIYFSTTIRPICLPSSKYEVGPIPLPDEQGYVIGWGATEHNFVTMKLRQLKIPIVSQLECLRNWENKSELIPENAFCAGSPKEMKDTCMGDSGSPLMQFRKNENGQSSWQVVGIASSGVDIECGKSTNYGFYTSIFSKDR
ncbi:hypothetical protein SNEBB_006722 [Seison nebaliae]|nr:hypothetical protein SNEBB_006722 [Seison nebaliae]